MAEYSPMRTTQAELSGQRIKHLREIFFLVLLSDL